MTPLVHEPTIRAQISGALPLSAHPGHKILLYMIFSIGAFDLSADNVDCAERYYEVAYRDLQDGLFEHSSLELVQGLTIMATYLQRSDRPQAGHLALGLAVRMAVGLGLHTPRSSWDSEPLEQEMRCRVWWSLVTLETRFSVLFERPVAISPALLRTARLPINCHDEAST